MKKTLIYSTMMQDVDACVYENRFHKERSVNFPMNEIIDEIVCRGDDVDVIIIQNNSSKINASEKTLLCENECREVLKNSGCKLHFEVINAEFDGEPGNIKNVYLELMEKFHDKREIYLDMTYGPKYLPFVVFAAMGYAEKYFESEINGIYYGQVFFERVNGKSVAVNPKLNELSSIYRLNSFCNNIETSKEAFKFMVKELFH